MKKIIPIALVFFLICNCTKAQNIQLTNEGNTVYVNAFNSGKVVFTLPSSGGNLSSDLYRHSPNEINPFSTTSFSWVLKCARPGRVFKDVSFANTQVGYIVTELGAVYKTTNGGNNWDSTLNLGFPYYWYGVHALTPDTVIIAGFNNQGAISSGVIRWTFNGGATWTPDIILRIASGVGWLDRVHFFNQNTGIVFAGLTGAIHYTTTGGKDSTSWTYVQVNRDLAWFAGNYDFQNSGTIYATGIHLAKSTNFGVNWVSGPSADNVFDGGIDFLDNNNLYGWTGGGQISSPVSGWVHRTTDGGTSWSARYDFPYPIRAVKFYSTGIGLALGGNLYQEAGGIYSTTNGGLNWNLDINTSAEMFSVETKAVSADSADIWCVGSTGSSTGFTGKLYKTRAAIVTGIENTGGTVPEKFVLYQNYPNPFNPVTKIKFDIRGVETTRRVVSTRIVVYNVLGEEVSVLVNRELSPGTYETKWNATDFPSGIYFYKLTAGDPSAGSGQGYSAVKKMILVK